MNDSSSYPILKERYDFKTIGIQSDIERLRKNGIVRYSIIIERDVSLSFEHIKRVSGHLVSSSTNINFADLESVGGDLSIYVKTEEPPLIDLKQLCRVGGDLYLQRIHLKSFGTLQEVGGTLSLKNAIIDDFDHFPTVKGNLHLSNRYKGIIEIPTSKVKGKIYFFKDTELKIYEQKTNQSTSPIPVPEFSPFVKNDKYSGIDPVSGDGYVSSLFNATKKQIDYYHYFKKKFSQGFVINLGGNYAYPRILFYELLRSYWSIIPVQRKIWIKRYDKLIEVYPYFQDSSSHFFLDKKKYRISWELYKKRQHYEGWVVGMYEEKLAKQLFCVDIILKMGFISVLSPWARKNIEFIKPFVKEEISVFESKWKKPFLKVFVDHTLNPTGDFSFLKQFYLNEDEYSRAREMDYITNLPIDYSHEVSNTISYAIQEQCKSFLINAEIKYRETIGIPNTGEYWKSETELYHAIKNIFNGTEVQQHASPAWLGLQHLDIYLPEYNIALEYQGIQHYQPVDYFGGQEGFEKAQERDKMKRKKCSENNCKLIYVNEGYKLSDVIEQIRSSMSKFDYQRAIVDRQDISNNDNNVRVAEILDYSEPFIPKVKSILSRLVHLDI